MIVGSACVGFLGCGSYLPEQRVSNDMVATAVGVDVSWIESRTAISTRHRAAPGQAASDLALGAAEEALREAGVTAEELSVIAVQPPLRTLPSRPRPASCSIGSARGVPPPSTSMPSAAGSCTRWSWCGTW